MLCTCTLLYMYTLNYVHVHVYMYIPYLMDDIREGIENRRYVSPSNICYSTSLPVQKLLMSEKNKKVDKKINNNNTVKLTV